MNHDEVLAAIEMARIPEKPWHELAHAINTHCNDLRATAERHQAAYDIANRPVCPRCKLPDPCPDYQQVIDRLIAWGVL